MSSIAAHLQCVDDGLDPRILRTRQMLRAAISALLHEKAFEAISIQDIAERSTVNRAMFYNHYSDKAALVEDFLLHSFNYLLKARQPTKHSSLSSEARSLILAACDFFTQRTGECSKHQRLLEPFVQSVIQKRLQQVLFEGLQKHSPDTNVSLAAATSSWTIYGAVTHWAQAENRAEPEAFADAISDLLCPIMKISPDLAHNSASKRKRPNREASPNKK
jgi:AcrR family transcriptional regulator